MVSITTVLQMHIHKQANTGVLRCSGTNGFINFGSSIRGERHNSYYADHTI